MATISLKTRMSHLFGLTHIQPKQLSEKNNHLHEFADTIARTKLDPFTATNCKPATAKRCLCCNEPAPKFKMNVCKWHQMNVCPKCFNAGHSLCRNCVDMVHEWGRKTAAEEPGTCLTCFTTTKAGVPCSHCNPSILTAALAKTKTKSTLPDSCKPPFMLKPKLSVQLAAFAKTNSLPPVPSIARDVPADPSLSNDLKIEEKEIYNSRWHGKPVRVVKVVCDNTFIVTFVSENDYTVVKTVVRSDLLSKYVPPIRAPSVPLPLRGHQAWMDRIVPPVLDTTIRVGSIVQFFNPTSIWSNRLPHTIHMVTSIKKGPSGLVQDTDINVTPKSQWGFVMDTPFRMMPTDEAFPARTRYLLHDSEKITVIPSNDLEPWQCKELKEVWKKTEFYNEDQRSKVLSIMDSFIAGDQRSSAAAYFAAAIPILSDSLARDCPAMMAAVGNSVSSRAFSSSSSSSSPPAGNSASSRVGAARALTFSSSSSSISMASLPPSQLVQPPFEVIPLTLIRTLE